jgi:type IV pilus assembly protein PilQ
VADFGTPVQAVSTFQSGDRVRMVVEPKGTWEHSAYQTDNQFVLEVRPVKVDPNKLAAGRRVHRREAVAELPEHRGARAAAGHRRLHQLQRRDQRHASPARSTLRLKDVPWDQALDIILQSKGLGVRKNGNVLWIAPKEELGQPRSRSSWSRASKVAELEPLRTQSFQLNYTKAETMWPRAWPAQSGGSARQRHRAGNRRASCRRAAA